MGCAHAHALSPGAREPRRREGDPLGLAWATPRRTALHAIKASLEEEAKKGAIWVFRPDASHAAAAAADGAARASPRKLPFCASLGALTEEPRPWQRLWQSCVQELQRDMAEELEVPANAALELMLEGDAALKALSSLQRCVELQEALAQIARTMATAIASEHLWPQLRVLMEEQQEDSMFNLALRGFEFKGIFFRVIVDEEDWRTISLEMRLARKLDTRRMLMTVEGLGLRLLASPVLESAAPESTRLLEHAQHFGHFGLGDVQTALPNPRQLLSLEVPLSRALRRCSAKVPMQCVALIFGGERANGQPEVVVAASAAALLEKVVGAFGCGGDQLRLHAEPGLFGCACEVWYLPNSDGAVWEWQSNRFSVLFASLPTRPPVQDDKEHSFRLPERLLAAAQQVAANPGYAQHPHFLRTALRRQKLPARFAGALAEVRLLGQSAQNQAVVEEAAAVDMVARAAKHVVRYIHRVRQGQGFFAFSGEAQPKAPLERTYAVDTAAGLEAPIIAKEAQLLSERLEVALEPPIPPLPEAKEAKSDAELEAQLMFTALEGPERSADTSDACAAMLHLAFWVRLASASAELSFWRDKDSSSVSTACSEEEVLTLSSAWGQRLFTCARRAPDALRRALQHQLRVSNARGDRKGERKASLRIAKPTLRPFFRCRGGLLLEAALEVLTDAALELPSDERLLRLRSPGGVANRLAGAALMPAAASEHYQLKYQAWRAKALLCSVQLNLLADLSTETPEKERDGISSRGLKAVASLLGELGANCPPELLAAFFALRGLICEREGDVDACYLHYLQALAAVDDAWGDPRRPGGRGHPFACFLVWKLGIIAYCRSDAKCVAKFGDYFRSLLLTFGEDVPFTWGPAAMDGLHDENAAKAALSAAKVAGLERWWRRHDVLHFIQDGVLAHCWPKTEDEPCTVSQGITGERQDVWRGTCFASGVNELGQLGLGKNDVPWSGTPVRVVALKEVRVSEVACGESHCVAVDQEGHLHAWGFDEYCQVGGDDRLFVRSPMSSPRPSPMSPRTGLRGCRVVPKPRKLNTSVTFASVACGAQFSLALDTQGQVWSWGSGEGGVLGLGPSSAGSGGAGGARSEPTKVQLQGCKEVACGSYHALAVGFSGKLFAWGRTEGGQLGLPEPVIQQHIEDFQLDDTCVCQPLPVPMPVELQSAAGGDVHSLALDVSGSCWSWGWGEFGQLGLGFSGASYQVGSGGMSSRRPTPTRIDMPASLGKTLLVACGGAFSAALVGQDLSSGGQLLMWGANDVGQCGLPPKQPMDIAAPREVPGLRNIAIRHVGCGTNHAVAIDLQGQAFSWGSSQFGKLGHSDGAPSGPSLVRALARLRLAKAACGLHHSLLVTDVRRRSSKRDSEGTDTSSGASLV
ncbi:unnamed protein product [Effrenium voratum]|uniref:RCC1-like domain-containing protein n=1 Tax=Effrenium voratum TaxID=2562239 RepID=A0AA36NDE4_9DINO|nr:unnamed protein product [Effrenium voratum]CAJ1424668.1 unnamed protein product [Effrenium voratum]